MPFRPGELVAHRFRVLDTLGAGGSADLLLVRDEIVDGLRALKVVRNSGTVALLEREFGALAGLRHRSIPAVFDFGYVAVPDGRAAFYTTRFVDGGDLSRFATTAEERMVVAVWADAVDGLAFLHARGLSHGDVSPKNILVDSRERGVLIDLGCATPLGDRPRDSLGALEYVAPEVLRGSALTAQTDLYAAGATLRAVLGDRASRTTARIIARCVADDPGARFTDAPALLRALGRDPDPAVRGNGLAPCFLGREAELARALDLLEDDPPAHCIRVTGPRGVGKTRYLTELRWAASRRGLPVVDVSARNRGSVFRAIGAIRGGDAPTDLASFIDGFSDPERPRAVLFIDDIDFAHDDDLAAVAALARLRDVTRVSIVIASPTSLGAGEVVIELEPLAAESISRWTGGLVPATRFEAFVRATRALPMLIERAMTAIAHGDVPETAFDDAPVDSGETLDAALTGLDEEAGRAFARIALVEAGVPDEVVDAHVVQRLVARGLVHRRDGLVYASSPLEPRALAASSFAATAAEVAEELRRASPVTSPETVRWAFHTGGPSLLEHAWNEAESFAIENPRAWRSVATLVAAVAREPRALVLAARVIALAGEPLTGARILSRAWLLDPGHDPGSLADLALYLVQAGRGASARVICDMASRRTTQPALRSRIADARARAAIQLGDPQGALDVAASALSSAPASLAPRLEESIGVAAALLGEHAKARTHLDRAGGVDLGTGARDAVRRRSYRGIAEYRAGEVARAHAEYLAALEVAEREGLADQLASCLANVGSTAQQTGDWGLARRSYERAERLARALDKHSTLTTVSFNRASLEVAIGTATDEMLVHAEAVAAEHDDGRALQSVRLLRAEHALLDGRPQAADELLARARGDGAADAGDEAPLRGAIAFALGDMNRARAALSDLRGRADATDVSLDGAVRFAMLATRVETERDARRGAIDALGRVVQRAEQAGLLPLVAEGHGVLAEALRALGSTHLAEQHQTFSDAAWDRIATTLEPAVQEVFWRRRRRRTSERGSHAEQRARRVLGDVRPILAISAKINSSLSVERILAAAMDAAVDLSGAERGFVLLVNGEDFTVEAARNVDREHLQKSHLKFSRSIARRVVESGTPLVTIDAMGDDRLRAETSIHAMKLRSVAAVPIRAPSGVLGVLYLDHRFERARFDDETIETLALFADQVAIALGNARLHAELAARTRELEQQKKSIEAKARAQAATIEELEREVDTRQRALELRHEYGQIVGRSAPMRAMLAVVDRCVESDVTVLIRGESGTGKELVARALHFNGARKKARFVGINCAAVAETLLETSLFGHVRGAFTGAVRDEPGLFVAASGGTLFLDEIGEMSLATQAKVLRALQERRIQPVGSTREVPIDVRVVAATHRDLEAAIARGEFRSDLYYRLAVIELRVPALRDRSEDLAELVAALLLRGAQAIGRDSAPEISAGALRRLARHDWPGNIRELENVLTRALVLGGGERIEAAHIELPKEQLRTRPRHRREFRAADDDRILRTLEEARWNITAACKELGLSRATLYRRIRALNVEPRG